MYPMRFGAMLGRTLFAVVAAYAAAQTPESPNADLGTPGEEHKRLDVLVGEWDVTAFMPVGHDWAMEMNYFCRAQWIMDGRFLRLEYFTTDSEGQPLRMMRYLGFDRHKGRYVELDFDNLRTDVMRSEGTLSKKGKTITCEGTQFDERTGRDVTVRTETTVGSKDEFTVTTISTHLDEKDNRYVCLTHKRRTEATDGPKLCRVNVRVSDMDKAASFYSELLGSPGRRVVGGSHHFECGSVMLALVNPTDVNERVTPVPDKTYVAFKNLEAVHARAATLGCLAKDKVGDARAGEIATRPSGERSFYVTDPFGNGICFVDAQTVFTGK